MSHTNSTTNYALPQFLSSDKPAWMADINVAFSDIDTAMKNNSDSAAAAQNTANDAVLNGAAGYSNSSTYAIGDVVNYLGRTYKCDIAVTVPEAFDNAKWSYYRLSDASNDIEAIGTIIGNSDITGIGDGTVTGAITELNNDLTVEEIPLTLDAHVVSGNIKAYKFGKVCYVCANAIQLDFTGGPYGVATGLPTPLNSFADTILEFAGTTYGSAYTTGGTLAINTSAPVNAYLSFSMMYMFN